MPVELKYLYTKRDAIWDEGCPQGSTWHFISTALFHRKFNAHAHKKWLQF